MDQTYAPIPWTNTTRVWTSALKLNTIQTHTINNSLLCLCTYLPYIRFFRTISSFFIHNLDPFIHNYRCLLGHNYKPYQPSNRCLPASPQRAQTECLPQASKVQRRNVQTQPTTLRSRASNSSSKKSIRSSAAWIVDRRFLRVIGCDRCKMQVVIGRDLFCCSGLVSSLRRRASSWRSSRFIMLYGGSFLTWIVGTIWLLLQKEGQYPSRECLYLNNERLERKRFTCLAILNCELKECCGAYACLRHDTISPQKLCCTRNSASFVCDTSSNFLNIPVKCLRSMTPPTRTCF